MAQEFNQTPSMISTKTGFFDILKPEDYEYDIREIAQALSKICRYTGHIADGVPFYSVAEHCVLVSHLCPKRYALAGLLHDASEAYVGDVSSPLKKLLKDYKPIEENIQSCIAFQFGVTFPFHESVKKADAEAYWLERASVAKPPAGAEDTLWLQEYKTKKGPKPIGLSPLTAEREFLDRFNEICHDKGTKTLQQAISQAA